MAFSFSKNGQRYTSFGPSCFTDSETIQNWFESVANQFNRYRIIWKSNGSFHDCNFFAVAICGPAVRNPRKTTAKEVCAQAQRMQAAAFKCQSAAWKGE